MDEEEWFCGTCGFDGSWLPENVTRCPECGRDDEEEAANAWGEEVADTSR